MILSSLVALSAASGAGSLPMWLGGGLLAGGGVSAVSASTATASLGGLTVAAKTILGSGKYVFPVLAGATAGGAFCVKDKRARALLAGTSALLVAGPLAGALAPVLGSASTGTAISSLKGAALWNAALAKLGGGTVASGGGGVALGTANVSAAGGIAGWMTGN